jgi:hypothetical protein
MYAYTLINSGFIYPVSAGLYANKIMIPITIFNAYIS